MKALLTLTMVACLAAPSPGATVIDAFTNWDGGKVTLWPLVAESFVIPPDSVLQEFRFGIDPRSPFSPAGTLQFQICPWGDTGPSGAPIFTRTVAWEADGAIDVADIGLSLPTGQLFGTIIDMTSFPQNGYTVHFNNIDTFVQGQLWTATQSPYLGWGPVPNADLQFRAVFVPEASALALAASACAAFRFRRGRRRRAA